MACAGAGAADPERGARLFATPAKSGLLSCADCHSDNPTLNNFGNIWVGRNAGAMIERAIQANTGGMGVFLGLFDVADLADIAAYLGNAPARLDFAALPPGSTSGAQSVTVSAGTKTGITGLSVQVEGDFVLAGGGCGSELARFSGCTVDVAFRPTTEGQRLGALVIHHDGTPTPVRLPLSGRGQASVPAVAAMDVQRMDFGAQPVGLSGELRYVQLRNHSAETLRLASVATRSPEFGIVGGSCVAGLVLAGGQRCSVALRFAPNGGGPLADELQIHHDGQGSLSSVTLSGIGLNKSVGRIGSDQAWLEFGTTQTGGVVPPNVLTLRNAGPATTTLDSISVLGANFRIDMSECQVGVPMGPLQACRIHVGFSPGRAALFSGQLQVSAGDDRLTIPLAGRAVQGQVLAALRPGRLHLRETVGRTTFTTVVLVNQGERPLRLGSPSLTGPEAADFRITGSGSCHRMAELAAGSSCEAELAFAPTQSGARNARLQWAIGGSTQFVATDLAGQADSSDVAWLWVDTVRLTFDEVVRQPPRSDGIRRIILANRGRAPLSWQGLAVTGAHSDDFQLGGNCDARSALTPGQQCELTVQFRPGEAGLRSASLVLWPAGEATAAMVTLSGTAVAIAAPALAALPAAAPSPLRWLVPPTTPTHERTAVGETAVSERWTVHNRSALPVSALRWHIDGEHATDFSVQADSGCILGQSLAPSASCTLVTRFHPSAAGPRRARLVIATADAGGGPPEVAELQALAFAPAGPALLAAPGSLNFESVVGTRPTPRRLWVENTGAGLLPVTSITLSSGALARTPTQPDGGCTEPPFVLGPGQRCAVDIEWNGVAMGGSAGLLIQSDSAHWTVPIGVSEDPAQRSNVGTGGGALGWSTFGLWLAVCALGWARRSESRNE